MKHLFLNLFLLLLCAACSPDDDFAETPAIEGPALIMFYTDN
ncbi:MAG: hypothetical protein ACOC9V_06315 [Chloroflexota bacterium]